MTDTQTFDTDSTQPATDYSDIAKQLQCDIRVLNQYLELLPKYWSDVQVSTESVTLLDGTEPPLTVTWVESTWLMHGRLATIWESGMGYEEGMITDANLVEEIWQGQPLTVFPPLEKLLPPSVRNAIQKLVSVVEACSIGQTEGEYLWEGEKIRIAHKNIVRFVKTEVD